MFESLGLERGVKGSEAKHERVRRVYGIMRDVSEKTLHELDQFEPKKLKTDLELHKIRACTRMRARKLGIELEAQKREKRLNISAELYQETGLRLATFGETCVGKIIVLARDFCIQKVAGVGLGLHSSRRFIEDAWRDYLDELFKGREDAVFRYDSNGDAKLSEPSSTKAGAIYMRNTGMER